MDKCAYDSIISELSATLNQQHAVDVAVNLSPVFFVELEVEPEDLGRAILLVDDGEEGQPKLKLAAVQNLHLLKNDLQLSQTGGLVARALEEAQAVVHHEFHNDRELTSLFELDHFAAIYLYPLMESRERKGIFLIAHPEPDFFNSERCKMLDLVGRQLAIAIHNASLFWKLEQEKQELIKLQEEWRNKLAHDLHDGPTQAAAAIAMRVNFVRRLMEKDPQAALDELTKVEDLARETTREIRKIAVALRSSKTEPDSSLTNLNALDPEITETGN